MRIFRRASLLPVVLVILGLSIILLDRPGSVIAATEEKTEEKAADKTEEKKSGEEKKEEKIAEKRPEEPKSQQRTQCIKDETIIQEIQRQQEELAIRSKEIEQKEQELKAREKALEEQIRELTQIREDINKTNLSRKVENEEKINKLIEAFENMSPKGAAQLLTNVDETLAVAAMSKLSTAKLAKVMNVMEPGKASRLSELMAGVVRSSHAVPMTRNQSVRGGDNNDGQNKSERVKPGGGNKPAAETAPVPAPAKRGG